MDRHDLPDDISQFAYRKVEFYVLLDMAEERRLLDNMHPHQAQKTRTMEEIAEGWKERCHELRTTLLGAAVPLQVCGRGHVTPYTGSGIMKGPLEIDEADCEDCIAAAEAWWESRGT